MPSVDVVIPNYQYGRFLRTAVKSVLDQGIPELRVLIIDNASTDDSVDVARQLAAEDRRVELIARSQNQGLIASLNEGRDWAQAKYVLILCADDMLVPGALIGAVETMESDPHIVLACGTDRRFIQGEPVPAGPEPQANAGWRVMTGSDYLRQRARIVTEISVSPLVRTSALKMVGPYRAEPGLMTDVEMQLRLATMGLVAETKSALAIQRLHDKNQSARYWGQATASDRIMEKAFDCFFAHEGRLLAETQELRRTFRQSIAGRTYLSGISRLVRGKPMEAFEFLRFAVTRQPSLLLLPPVGRLWSVLQETGRIDAMVNRFRITARG